MSDTVQEARADLEAAMSWLTTDESPRVDALVAAVRAEERARLVAVVEGLQTYLLSSEMPHEEVLVERKDVLAALTGADK